MRLVKSASGKRTLKITRAEWAAIGKQAGWRDMLPSERLYGEHPTSSELDAPEEGEEREAVETEEGAEEEAEKAFQAAERHSVEEFLGKQVAKADARLKALLDETSVGGVGRQEALTRAAHILDDIFEQVPGVDPKENALGKLRGFVSSSDEPHPGVAKLKAMVKQLEEQLGVVVSMPTPEEFKPERKREDKEMATAGGRIRITKEAWAKIGKRKGWLGTDKMKSEVKEDTGKLVVQIPGGKESEVEFSYTLTLKPHDKTNSPVRESTYKITGSNPKLSDKEMDFAHEQVKKWMKEHGAENAKAQE